MEIGTKTSDVLVPMTDGRALVACLQRIALHHRMPATSHSLTTGLPTTLDEFTPALLVRAARRAGLRARLQALDVATIPRAALPALILLEDNLGKGTGLGGSISYGIIQDMHGDIWAENTKDGAKISIRLPVHEDSVKTSSEEAR